MPVNTELALQQWVRYQYCRDNGHNEFVEKAETCDKYFRGLQWQSTDLAKLQSQRRPALTINKILSTISNVMGEQIYNRTDTTIQPSAGAPAETAVALTKVFRQISDTNQLDWKRSDMFCDGIITSRGFLEARLDFTDQMVGEVRIEGVNPKNVIIDPDAEDYDPDSWNDVLVTKWMTWHDIAVLYNKEDAEFLKDRNGSWFQYGFDSIERVRDRFGPDAQKGYFQDSHAQSDVLRNIRVIERQHRVLDKQLHFVDPNTGDMRPIPQAWSQMKIASVAQQFTLTVLPKMVKRIRWTVTADNVVLHDDWSPYKYFTIVPFFPYFRRGKTIGLVENLLGPQELLNKVSSQELHVVNTTANSGWKVRTGALKNMTVEELEQRGAETGLVLVLDDIINAEKIQPNQIPSGLDRISYKAEEHIKTISAVTDYQSGNAREDVSAKAVQENLKRGSLNQAKPLDSLSRTDWLLARHVLAMVQTFYTEPRLINITHNKITGEQAQVEVNQPTPEGTITNDLTVGEYDIVVTSTPHKATLEQSQFEQAQALKELGIPIPDEILIEHSSLYRKDEVLKKMAEAAQSEEAQHAMEVKKLGAELELANLKAEAARTGADAVLKQAKARKESTNSAIALNDAQRGDGEQAKVAMEMQQAAQEHGLRMDQLAQEGQISVAEMQAELEFKRQELELKREELELKRREAAMKFQMNAQASGLKLGVAHETSKVKVAHARELSKVKLSQEKRNGARKPT